MTAPTVYIAETSHVIYGRGAAAITITIQRRDVNGVLQPLNLSGMTPVCDIRDPVAQNTPLDPLLENNALVPVTPATGIMRLDLDDAQLALLQRPGPPEETADYLVRVYVPEIDYYPDRFWLHIEYVEA